LRFMRWGLSKNDTHILMTYGLGVSFIIWIFYVLVVNIVLKFVFSMLAMLFAYILMFDIDIPH